MTQRDTSGVDPSVNYSFLAAVGSLNSFLGAQGAEDHMSDIAFDARFFSLEEHPVCSPTTDALR